MSIKFGDDEVGGEYCDGNVINNGEGNVCIALDDFLFLFSKREVRAHNLLKGIRASG